MNWLCWHVGTVTDPKFAVIARRCNTTPANVIAIWAFLLERGAHGRVRGEFGKIDPEDCASCLGIEEETIGRVLTTLDIKALTSCGKVVNWDKRQNNASGERVRRYREKLVANNRVAGDHARHRDSVMKRDGHECVYCWSPKNLVIDHMWPVTQGGTNAPDNLATACKRCNSGKSGRTPEQAGFIIRSPEAAEAYERYKRSRSVTEVIEVTLQTDRQTDIQTEGEAEVATDLEPESPAREKIACRLSDTWEPDTALKDWAKKERPDLDGAKTLASFHDYWCAKPGHGALKLDWAATFRNWVRSEKAPPRAAPQHSNNGFGHKPIDLNGEEARWRVRVASYMRDGKWREDLWGPEPGHAGCCCPRALLPPKKPKGAQE